MNETYYEWLKKRPKYKTLKDWNPALIDKVLERHPRKQNNFLKGFISRVVTGKPGHGKSMLCYKYMAKLDYVINGYTKVDDEEESYRFALDNMIYRPYEFFSRIETQIDKGIPFLVWTLDDCSIHMGKQLWDADRKSYRRLQDLLPAIREYVTFLLINTITVKLLAKPFREFFDTKIDITLEEGFTRYPRRGKHYFKEFYPDDIRFRMYHPYDDRFSVLVPEPFYSWYDEKKNKALKEYHKMRKESDMIQDYNEHDNEDLNETF